MKSRIAAEYRRREGRAIDAPPKPTNPLSALTVVKSTWSTGGFGSVAIWKVTFRSDADWPVGNIVYETNYYSETGNVVDKGGAAGVFGSGKTIQRVIPPGKSRTIEVNDGFLNSQAVSANFRVTAAEFVLDAR